MTTPPSSDQDVANTQFAIGIELSARDLYRAAIEAGASGTAWALLANQHASYAHRLAGIIGALVAVPLIAVLNTGIRRLARRRPEVPPDAVIVTASQPAG